MSDATIAAVEELFSYKGSSQATYGIGEQVIQMLLGDRRQGDLSPREASLLLKGYNWAGRHKEAFEYARFAVQTWGEGFLNELNIAHYNAHWWPGEEFLTTADQLIRDRVGYPAFWHMRKADYFLMNATGERGQIEEFEWHSGDPIVDRKALEESAAELALALAVNEKPKDPPDPDWNERFRAVLEQPGFETLRWPSNEA
jgi:hypothetical protein